MGGDVGWQALQYRRVIASSVLLACENTVDVMFLVSYSRDYCTISVSVVQAWVDELE